jgi:hypothetical protein
MEMRIGKRAMTKIVAAAAIGLGAFGAAQQASASLIIDLRATQINGAPIGGSNTAKSVSVAPGDVVTLSIFARANGVDGVSTNEGVQSVAGNITSSVGGLLGNLSAAPYPGDDLDADGIPDVRIFNALGAQNGKVQNLDADSDLDVGTPMTNQNVTDFFNARSANMAVPNVVVDANTREIRVGTATFTVAAGADGSTLLQFINRVENNGAPATEGAVWREDGAVKNPTNGTYLNGTPVSVSVVPEPTSLALAGLAGLGMLNRRRKNA